MLLSADLLSVGLCVINQTQPVSNLSALDAIAAQKPVRQLVWTKTEKVKWKEEEVVSTVEMEIALNQTMNQC